MLISCRSAKHVPVSALKNSSALALSLRLRRRSRLGRWRRPLTLARSASWLDRILIVGHFGWKASAESIRLNAQSRTGWLLQIVYLERSLYIRQYLAFVKKDLILPDQVKNGAVDLRKINKSRKKKTRYCKRENPEHSGFSTGLIPNAASTHQG